MTIAVLAAVIAGTAGCSDESDKLLGSWARTETTAPSLPTKLVFSDDGTCVVDGEPGTWRVVNEIWLDIKLAEDGHVWLMEFQDDGSVKMKWSGMRDPLIFRPD